MWNWLRWFLACLKVCLSYGWTCTCGAASQTLLGPGSLISMLCKEKQCFKNQIKLAGQIGPIICGWSFLFGLPNHPGFGLKQCWTSWGLADLIRFFFQSQIPSNFKECMLEAVLKLKPFCKKFSLTASINIAFLIKKMVITNIDLLKIKILMLLLDDICKDNINKKNLVIFKIVE